MIQNLDIFLGCIDSQYIHAIWYYKHLQFIAGKLKLKSEYLSKDKCLRREILFFYKHIMSMTLMALIWRTGRQR